MRKLGAVIIGAAACLMIAGALQAQTATGKAWYTGPNGAYANFDGSLIYTDPYYMRIWYDAAPPSGPGYLPPGGVSSFGPVYDVFCIDWYGHIYSGDTFNANFTNLGMDGADIGTATRSGNDLTHYLAAAYLADQMKFHGLDKTLGSGAIWWVMAGSPTLANGTSVIALGTMALTTGYKTVNPYEWTVITDKNAAGYSSRYPSPGEQEFIAYATPEPATLLLLGTGLVVVLLAAGALRKPTA